MWRLMDEAYLTTVLCAADDLVVSCLWGALHKGNDAVVFHAADDLETDCLQGGLPERR